MSDIVDPATRSRMMSGIKGKNTKPERLIRSLLHRRGFRFRLHVGELSGKPDLVLRRYNAVIFVHGCFWHGHDCSLFKWPSTRSEFWREKIQRNQGKDAEVIGDLLEKGWRVCTVWECALKGQTRDVEKLGDRIGRWLRGNRRNLEIRL